MALAASAFKTKQTNKCSTMPKPMSANNSKIIHLGDMYQALSFRMREAFNILAFTLKASQKAALLLFPEPDRETAGGH